MGRRVIMKKGIGKYWWLWGLWGFWGCFGFRYFFTHEIGDLFYFSFFAFFGFYFIGKLSLEMPDERYKANAQKAISKAAFIPAIALFIIGFSGTFPFGTKELMVTLSALGWAAFLITYAILFYYYEKL
ncbi:MAG: DUF3796 domain-containing protein [Peptococcaceae bacterium]|nr:DUF3796 domain-containing protein [Peptococcaceae bacterium]